MNRKHYLTAAFLLCANLTFGQEQANKTWSLQDCMDYAAEHNIQLQKSKLTEQQGELDLIQKKAELFPSLSFSTTQTLTYRPLQESASNIVTDGIANSSTNKLTENGSYGLNASWNVWDGGINRKIYQKPKNPKPDQSTQYADDCQQHTRTDSPTLHSDSVFN